VALQVVSQSSRLLSCQSKVGKTRLMPGRKCEVGRWARPTSTFPLSDLRAGRHHPPVPSRSKSSGRRRCDDVEQRELARVRAGDCLKFLIPSNSRSKGRSSVNVARWTIFTARSTPVVLRASHTSP